MWPASRQDRVVLGRRKCKGVWLGWVGPRCLRPCPVRSTPDLLVAVAGLLRSGLGRGPWVILPALVNGSDPRGRKTFLDARLISVGEVGVLIRAVRTHATVSAAVWFFIWLCSVVLCFGGVVFVGVWGGGGVADGGY